MENSSWDRAMERLLRVAPDTPFLVLHDEGSWQIFRWAHTGGHAMVNLEVAGLLVSYTAPARLPVPGHTASSITELADAVGAPEQEGLVFSPLSGRSVFPSPPRGIDGARQNPGVRHAPVLDAPPGVLACSACAARGRVQMQCPCGPAGHLLNLPCALCGGTRVVTQPCEVCGGAGSYLWPATLRVRRYDAGSGPDGDSEIALDVDLTGCDVSIERSILDSGDSVVWEDRWVVDLYRPFSNACRALGIEWPHGVVWLGSVPAIAARVSTAFTLLRVGTPTQQELALQPHLDPWLVREGPASPVEVLDPELLGLQAASIVARISRGVVLVSPLPPVEQLVARCTEGLAARGLRLGLGCAGPSKVVVAVDADGAPATVIAHGATVAEALLLADHLLTS